MNFNPRSREVSDTAGRWYHFTVGNFNPRSREVSDALSDHMALALLNFNPRSREVSDRLPPLYTSFLPISIHAPAR